ncbi:MAG: prephenate dehydrogenase [Anaerolineae bacterium]|nr:prephenate dehydrogenase [Anaerolineae bacterium]
MTKPKIAIIGLGVVGTSLGLALRKANADYELIGHDRDPLVSRGAGKAGAVHKTEWNLIAAIEDADAIILALPLPAIRDTLQPIAPYLKTGVVITDTANVKAPVMAWAKELLPDHVNFVGGNPILPMGKTGLEPDADLFSGGVYCLTPSPTAAPIALDFMTDLVRLIGAQPFFLDAAEHDGLIAGGEHLPMVIAAALLRATQGAVSWREMRKVAGAAYESGAYLGPGDSAAYRYACQANSANIVRWIDEFMRALAELRRQIEEGDADRVDESFRQALEMRRSWMKERAAKEWDRAEQRLSEPPRTSFLRQAILGGGLPPSRKDEGKKGPTTR